MTVQTWLAVAGLALSIVSGLAAWMYRVDRNLTRITTELKSIGRLLDRNEREHESLHQRINTLDNRGDADHSRLTRVETQLQSLIG